MHLILPYAASHALTGPEVFAGLELPQLQALLGRLQHQQTLLDADTHMALHMPHERLRAQTLGWAHDALSLPWAAWQNKPSSQDSLPGQVDPVPQAWMTPCHWQIGMDQVVMADPEHLHLSDEESQQLLQAMQAFLLEDGLQVTWQSALQWHVQGALLTDLPTVSLDRVIGQNVKNWMPDHPATRPFQRLQSEMQMLLYNHPVNDAREARRQHTVNAFWLHGAGVLRGQFNSATPAVKMPDTLRSSALRGDVQAWRQAWQHLDATAVADALQHLQTTGQITLSLCSEHAAHTYTAAPAAWHQKITRLFNKPSPAAALQALITN
ncbi:hypothetical protein [Limnohabitans sp. Rim28]|uniref:hypothetical protein n=1 Tax=Limnohabitans sp. Rim28 TaxID=1100720 RepID=UPI000300FA3F|nr:hypothetical protein [Limnohabitans sp. Rim28]PVE08274.1 hypothetical protein B472_04575 [Limnohabitans sp. Rim28]